MNNKNALLELCRAKRLDNGEWVEGNLIRSGDAEDGQEAIIIPAMNKNMFIGQEYAYLGFNYWYRVDPSTICHCTGHKDKNDKLIWEHDIVKNFNSAGDEWSLSKIVFGEYSLCLGWCQEGLKSLNKYARRLFDVGFSSNDAAKCLVVGNVFDNPEFTKFETNY